MSNFISRINDQRSRPLHALNFGLDADPALIDAVREQMERDERREFWCDICDKTFEGTVGEARRAGWQVTERETFCAYAHD